MFDWRKITEGLFVFSVITGMITLTSVVTGLPLGRALVVGACGAAGSFGAIIASYYGYVSVVRNWRMAIAGGAIAFGCFGLCFIIMFLM